MRCGQGCDVLLASYRDKIEKAKAKAKINMMLVTLNGESRSVAPGTSIAQLAEGLGLDPRKIAVERNLAIVPRSTLAEVLVEDGDQLEIVHFVGGG